MAERATDVLDVRSRIVAELRGVPAPGIPVVRTPFILVAEDLAPADTATLDPEQGPRTGDRRRRPAVPHRDHRPLPRACPPWWPPSAWTNCRTAPRCTWTARPAPSPPTRTISLRAAAEAWAATASLLAEFNGTGATADGHLVPLLANVGGAKDAVAAAKLGRPGRGPVPDRVLLPGAGHRAHRGGAGRRLQGRLRCLPGQEGGAPHARRRRGQAAAVPDRLHRAQPGPGRPRLPDGLHHARASWSASCRRSPWPRRIRGRRLGDGPDDFHGRGGCPVRHDVRRGRHQDARRDGGGSVRGPHRRGHPARSAASPAWAPTTSPSTPWPPTASSARWPA